MSWWSSATPKNKSFGLASSAFARHYLRNLCWCLFLALLRCFSSGGSPRTPILFNARYTDIVCVGCPIRKSTDQWIFAPSRGLSQLVTSFVGSWCQGIPLALFIAWPIENSRSLARSRLWIMQASQIVEIVIVTHHLFRCCSTIKYLNAFRVFSDTETSLLPYLSLFITLFSFQGASSNFFWSQIEILNSLSTSI